MHDEFTALGATLVAISPQRPEHNRAQIEERELPFEILTDPGNGVAARHGLRHVLPADLREVYTGFGIALPDYNGDDSWSLPVPARYIIDEDFAVCYAAKNADYTRRPEPEETLAALRALCT